MSAHILLPLLLTHYLQQHTLLSPPERLLLSWEALDSPVGVCFGCGTRDSLPKVSTNGRYMFHLTYGREGSATLHGAYRPGSFSMDDYELEPMCFTSACRRSILVSLETLQLSLAFRGLTYSDLKKRRCLMPYLEEVKSYTRKPTRELEAKARKLTRYILRNRIV